MAIRLFCLSLYPKKMRKYAKYSNKRIGLTGTIISGNSYRKIVVLRDHIVPWFDENGIYYIGLEDFCLEYIDELDSTM